MKLPKVTVIIVFLNEEIYLAEAIDSVFCQTWQDWELLLVDDGSTDRSTEIARDFQIRFPERVKYFEHDGHVNRGISISRNLGISHAGGEYIAFLDADDVWTSSKLEHQVTILDRDADLAMTFGRLRYFTCEPDLPIPEGVAPLRVPSGVLYPPVVFTQSLIGDAGMLWTSGTILFRKPILIAAGSFETDFPGAGEDAVVWLKINLHFPIYASDECLLLYRRHNRGGLILASTQVGADMVADGNPKGSPGESTNKT
ncbi:MAG TPA: glycosyltransferase family A protein [Pyrinomonadaceae bacterium]|jgi:glycosyltransferase involved in cell wall biosynthesis